MNKNKSLIQIGIPLALALALSGCGTTCLDSKNLQPIAETQQITQKNIVITAATLPNGNPSPLSVKQYCPDGEKVNKIVVGWSKTSVKPANIEFPAATFGNGPSNVEMSACHYNSLGLKAYDKDGKFLSQAQHTAGQNTLQTLKLNNGQIRRVDISGAEIGIRKICYRK